MNFKTVKKNWITLTGTVILIFAGILVLFAFKESSSKTHPDIDYPDYNNLWKVVDSLEQENLNKSALEKVEQIYILAKKSENTPQIVKSLIYKVKYKQVLEEGGFEKALNDFETEIQHSHFPTKNILQSCAAELYWSYYQQNRWRFSNRTQVVNYQQDDVSTWDLKKITQRVTSLYKASIGNSDSLKQISIESFGAILEKGNMPTIYRPTLYDFLVHRTLDFFMNDEAYLTQPAYKFNITGEEVFHSTDKFINLKIETKDTTSGKFLALQILQDLLRFHLKDPVSDALVDVELKRFEFLRNNSISDYKDSLYLKGLQNLEQRFTNDSASAPVSYAIAQFYYNQSTTYQPPQDTINRWDKKIALSYCEKVTGKFSKTRTAGNCRSLEQSIVAKDISLTVEQVNIPGSPFRGLLQFRNADQAEFRIIRNSDALEDRVKEQDEEMQMKIYLAEPVIQRWSQKLPEAGDYQQHSAEIKIPALPVGEYVILGSTSGKFLPDTDAILKTNTTISNLSYISKRNKANYGFYVFDRESGKVLKGVTARVLSQQYDYNTRKTLTVEKGKYFTDESGYFEVPAMENNQNFRVEFLKGEDRLRANDYFYLYRNDEQPQKTIHCYLFTDRAIYRPGQTIYFKGIVVQSAGDSNSLMTRFKTVAELYDVNGQKVQSLDLITNDYGSFNGTFTAPSAGVNGEMVIRNSFGFISISVEEYKRPRFEVIFDTLKGSFQLNDVVSVKGLAKSYSGANIDGAAVSYRVVRQARPPIWYWGWKEGPYGYNREEMEITNGTTSTDAIGTFEISFTAIPDLKIPKKEKPQFNYKVYADVVDINGETHSAEMSVSIGYISLNADINIPDNVSKDSLDRFTIITENLSGTFEPAQGTINVYSLKSPEKIFRNRLWNRPDQFIMSKDEFYKSFPYDPYDNENDFTSWEKKSRVSEQSFNTSVSKTVPLSGLKSGPQGKYLLELVTKDKYGEEVKVLKYFTLYSLQDKQPPLPESLWNSSLPETAEAGNIIPLQVGTAEKEITMMWEVEGKKYNERQILSWKKGKKNMEIPVTENLKGGISVSIISIHHSRIYVQNKFIAVPYSDKELKIGFESFREKLIPGQNEEWKIKISGSKGESVGAEMVASMYDASLDAFRPNQWSFNISNPFFPYSSWDGGNCFGIETSYTFMQNIETEVEYFTPQYDQLNWFGLSAVASFNLRGRNGEPLVLYNVTPEKAALADGAVEKKAANESSRLDSSVQKTKASTFENAYVRKNLQETAFFYPQLQTNEAGEIIIKFTIPEALTRWKFQGLAHTKDLKYGMITKEIVTQKDLMITPNAPRFLRTGDQIYFAAKITNLSDHDITGNAALQLFDAKNMKSADQLFANNKAEMNFSVKKGQSVPVSWQLTVPENIEAVDYKVIAISGNQSDGEENIIPVISNRILITETLPLNVRGNATKKYSFTNFLNSGSSSTLKNYQLTLEFTSNPAWYAVQALPYLMEYPYECTEQTFNRYYANALATNITISNPRIRLVFDQWKNLNEDALLSNLEKNQELKSLILQETPWVREGQDETERKKRIALLFDLNRMSNETENSLNRLADLQTPNGGWAWFAGGPDDRYITQYIVAGLGHMKHLNVLAEKEKTEEMLRLAIPYMDSRISEDYEKLKKLKAKPDENQLNYYSAQYLYARSFFNDVPLSENNKKSFDYFESQARKFWTKQGIYGQAMIALALQRNGDKKTAAMIIRSLKENAINNEELGMYWKSNTGGYYWYQAPIETQALLIEAFEEISKDETSVDNMKIWLLKEKQTNDWKTTKATADAVYALLISGNTLLTNEPDISVSLGDLVINSTDQSAEAGTGYFKKEWTGNEFNSRMGNITISSKNNTNGISWGAIYWQYFEQLDKITPSSTPLSLQKKLFLQRNIDTGPKLEPINDATILKPGDLIKVRIELRSDRDMEYVHMKDLRAACFEPLNVLSEYRWQDGLGYYEETKDASTNFFFDHLPKGIYVFEYSLRAELKGNFSNGVTTIQCMYAPEFTSHSEGIKVKVE